MEEKKIDITKYPEGAQAIVDAMTYIEDEKERWAVLWGFVYKTFSL